MFALVVAVVGTTKLSHDLLGLTSWADLFLSVGFAHPSGTAIACPAERPNHARRCIFDAHLPEFSYGKTDVSGIGLLNVRSCNCCRPPKVFFINFGKFFANEPLYRT